MFIKTENLTKALGGKSIFSGVTLMLTDHHKIGVIGKNGSGKSTFLKILTKEITPDRGRILFDPPSMKVTYFSQILEIDALNLELEGFKDKNLKELTGFVYLLAQDPEIFKLWKQMTYPGGNEDFSELIDRYSELGGYDFETKILTECKKLGFDPNKPVLSYSGGQKTRLQIAKLFLFDSDVLLLDEPTNHLDQDGLEIFYDYVKKFKGIILIASHDRNLLTECVDKIILFENGRVAEYTGNYDFYQKEKLGQRVAAEEQYRQNEKKVDKLNSAAVKLGSRISKHEEKVRIHNEIVTRVARLSKKNKAAKTKIIKNKLKIYRDNDKMQAHFLIQRQQRKMSASRSVILDRAHKTSLLTKKAKIGWSLKLDFDTKVMEGNYSFRVSDLSAGYGEKAIIKNFNLVVGATEKIAITGANGSGKTTLLKSLANKIKPMEGIIEFSPQASLGYLDQENLSLDNEATVISEFMKDARHMEEAEARSFLHFFLFEGEMPLRKVKTLSEGEKVKLKLAKLLYSKSNILLLDEPTNHLDLPSQEVVEKALKDFDGSLVLVSHDKTLIRNLGIQKVVKF
jgi:ATP-binding cassette subfamily F protein 3